MKRFFMFALFFAVPWTIIIIAFRYFSKGESIIDNLVPTSIFGLIAGGCFSGTIIFMTTRLYKRTVIELEEDEQLVKEGGANHFKGKEGVGGKLVLSDRRLIFKSHRINIQNHTEYYELETIDQVQAGRTLGVLKNQLQLQLSNGQRHQFVVDDPEEWVKQLKEEKRLKNTPVYQLNVN